MHHVHLKDTMQVTTVYFVLLPFKKVNTALLLAGQCDLQSLMKGTVCCSPVCRSLKQSKRRCDSEGGGRPAETLRHQMTIYGHPMPARIPLLTPFRRHWSSPYCGHHLTLLFTLLNKYMVEYRSKWGFRRARWNLRRGDKRQKSPEKSLHLECFGCKLQC